MSDKVVDFLVDIFRTYTCEQIFEYMDNHSTDTLVDYLAEYLKKNRNIRSIIDVAYMLRTKKIPDCSDYSTLYSWCFDYVANNSFGEKGRERAKRELYEENEMIHNIIEQVIDVVMFSPVYLVLFRSDWMIDMIHKENWTEDVMDPNCSFDDIRAKFSCDTFFYLVAHIDKVILLLINIELCSAIKNLVRNNYTIDDSFLNQVESLLDYRSDDMQNQLDYCLENWDIHTI